MTYGRAKAPAAGTRLTKHTHTGQQGAGGGPPDSSQTHGRGRRPGGLTTKPHLATIDEWI
ncbi:hypothetical protein OHB54_04850 [Streptomyces sp. NBC_01007]|nr:hypothetical protein OHB54_04850 [Streptomyces sp. NBC_01007]